MRNFRASVRAACSLLLAFAPSAGLAHDPVFGLGPHTLFKGGVEIHAGVSREEAGDDKEMEYLLELKYGITGDWTVGVSAPLSMSAVRALARLGQAMRP